jgi:protein-tyrosine-phosphatase/N-acetylglutamate synthase-like GNAT family acetyltransferase
MNPLADIQVRSARASDLTAVVELLAGTKLPTSDLATAPGLRSWVAEAGNEIVGVIAMERYDSGGLLRALVVAPSHQRHGLGRELVAHLEEQARSAGVEQLILLTQTAEPFFRAQGYSLIDRQYVPEDLKQSEEFRSLCPATAVCMTKSLAPSSAKQSGSAAESRYNVLFLCTGNSARSILSEGLLNHWGAGRFRAFSAGSHPSGKVNPFALELLEAKGMSLENPRSKSWDEFAASDAPYGQMNLVVTVCDNAAGEVCPIWPGHPMSAHWGVEDPAAVQGSDQAKRQAFRAAFETLQTRIQALVKLPIAQLSTAELKARLKEIGHLAGAKEA